MTWIMSLSCALLVTIINLQLLRGVQGKPQVPCFFIFGDSLSDSGNNNNLATLAKSNFLPYGIDFPDGPTGRFTNGRTTVDLIGDQLGLESYIPPFPRATDSIIAKGVNYASGSAGIRPETGFEVGQRISMDQQLENHKNVVTRIGKSMRYNSASTHLNKCLYSVYVGSNDWMLKYFGGGDAAFKFNPQLFADALITQLSQQMTGLYNMGARKVILFGMGPLGCLPPLNRLGVCSAVTNGVLEMYNTKLKSLAETLNTKYKDAKFIWINTIGIVSDDLKGLGMKVTNVPCCGSLQLACLPNSIPCPTRADHAYWDNAHPTEAANRVLAGRAFKATQATDVYPMDIRELAQLNLKSTTHDSNKEYVHGKTTHK